MKIGLRVPGTGRYLFGSGCFVPLAPTLAACAD